MNLHWVLNKVYLGITLLFVFLGVMDANHHAWGYLTFDGLAVLLNLWCAQDEWKRFMKNYDEYRRHRW